MERKKETEEKRVGSYCNRGLNQIILLTMWRKDFDYMKTLILNVNILPSVSKPNIALMLCISCTPKTSFQEIVVMAVNVFFVAKDGSI